MRCDNLVFQGGTESGASQHAWEERIKTLYLDAITLPPDERFDFINHHRDQDDRVNARVRELLIAEQCPTLPVLEVDFGGLMVTEVCRKAQTSGSVSSRYKLGEELGRGGNAIVYAGKQVAPVKREIAIKILRSDVVNVKQLVQRFECECITQAAMDHPNIARFLDAGQTEDELPFLVIERIRGKQITEFCDDKELSIHERLELFMQVCDGVQHAHQQGVIHRDLKPGNILIAEENNCAIPKIIDFGIAKTLGSDLACHTDLTFAGQRVGSPAYMSPEQVDSNAHIDTRSDIFSLGVVLYELLTGRHPFVAKHGHEDHVKLARRICSDDPLALSNLSLDCAAEIVRKRKTNVRKFVTTVKSELQWIVSHCLEKDRDFRYQTVHELKADLKHYLRHEPVSVSPPSQIANFWKFARRNKAIVTLALLVVLSLLFGIATTSFALRSAIRAKSFAEAEKEKAVTQRFRAERVFNLYSNFFDDLQLAIPDMENFEYRECLKRSLDQEVEIISSEPNLTRPVELEVRRQIGHLLLLLKYPSQAEIQFRAGAEISENIHGAGDWKHMAIIFDLARSLEQQGKKKDAETLFSAIHEFRNAHLPANNIDLALTKFHLATYKTGIEAESLYREALSGYTKHRGGPFHRSISAIKYNQGWFMWENKRFLEAVKIFSELLADEEQYSGSSDARTIRAQFALAECLYQIGDFTTALHHLESMEKNDKSRSFSEFLRLKLVSMIHFKLDNIDKATQYASEALASVDESEQLLSNEFRKFVEGRRQHAFPAKIGGTDGYRQ